MVHATQGEAPYRVDIVAAGHDLTADEPPANGGRNVGPSPFDLVVAGLAACTMITLQHVRRAQRLGRLRHLRQVAASDGGSDSTFHRPGRKVEVSGVPDAAGLERLRDIVERTPVTLALKPGFTISTVLAEAAPGAAP